MNHYEGAVTMVTPEIQTILQQMTDWISKLYLPVTGTTVTDLMTKHPQLRHLETKIDTAALEDKFPLVKELCRAQCLEWKRVIDAYRKDTL